MFWYNKLCSDIVNYLQILVIYSHIGLDIISYSKRYSDSKLSSDIVKNIQI